MNLKKLSVLKEPSMMSQWMTPSSRDSAGNTEYLEYQWPGISSNYICSTCPHSPLATTKESFPGSLPTTKGPGPSTISSATINSTFIHKNKLVGVISAYASCEVCSFLNTSLNCDARELFTIELVPPDD